jgi:hypothetical protein
VSDDVGFPKEGTCSLCGGHYDRYGHNPAPLGKFEERCCDTCNETRVIPARIRAHPRPAAQGKDHVVMMVLPEPIADAMNDWARDCSRYSLMFDASSMTKESLESLAKTVMFNIEELKKEEEVSSAKSPQNAKR